MKKLINALKNNKVIAYPTESTFGLGCDPDSNLAIKKILYLKKRTWKKGFILVAAYLNQLKEYVDYKKLNNIFLKRMLIAWPGPINWLLPKKKKISCLLSGKFTSLAVRISSFFYIRKLCKKFKKPIISTSANISGFNPAYTSTEVENIFGKNILIMKGKVGGRKYPCDIRDLKTGRLIR
ncbi:MAG: Sua5/YciO/YrdC/YwlC family protein [Enterobacteriaceae bacterium]